MCSLKKLGRATWILGTSLLVIGVPLVMEVEREHELLAQEKQWMARQQASQASVPVAGLAPSTLAGVPAGLPASPVTAGVGGK